eukprot:TRINITY_DN5345_c0_g2_i1.p1 TRINITY_DN5345_c0_g2~~TRINITY_DN5345_c0_g2_i1.p1  ORF type:complete len:682 (-),score=99.80 TRINITY_DN5345_c0_g2_i1:460-2505(-)
MAEAQAGRSWPSSSSAQASAQPRPASAQRYCGSPPPANCNGAAAAVAAALLKNGTPLNHRRQHGSSQSQQQFLTTMPASLRDSASHSLPPAFQFGLIRGQALVRNDSVDIQARQRASLTRPRSGRPPASEAAAGMASLSRAGSGYDCRRPGRISTIDAIDSYKPVDVKAPDCSGGRNLPERAATIPANGKPPRGPRPVTARAQTAKQRSQQQPPPLPWPPPGNAKLPGFWGTYVEVPADHVEEGYLDAIEYRPPESFAPGGDTDVVGLVIMLPGSCGGLGPGLNKHPQPFDNVTSRGAHGGIYMRLAHELAAGGREFTWEYKPKKAPEDFSVDARPAVRRPASAGSSPQRAASCDPASSPEQGGAADSQFFSAALFSPSSTRHVVSLQMDWSTTPRRILRRLSVLECAVLDVEAAAQWLCSRFPGRPLAIIGFSFGGPAMWASANRLPPHYNFAGAASIAGSARGGTKFAEASLNTIRCVHELGKRCLLQQASQAGPQGSADAEQGKNNMNNAPAFKFPPSSLFVHGTHDTNVALQIGEYLCEQAAQPKRFVRINWATHHLNTARDAVYGQLKQWVVATLGRWHRITQATFCIEEDETDLSALAAGSCEACTGYLELGPKMPARVSLAVQRGDDDMEATESWRQAPIRRRRKKCEFQQAAGDADHGPRKKHPLAGLIGYSE